MLIKIRGYPIFVLSCIDTINTHHSIFFAGMYMNKNITSLLNLVSPYILLYPVLSCFHTITAILNLYKFRASFNILSVFSRMFQNLLEFFKILTLFLSQCQSWRNDPSKHRFPSLVTQWRTFLSHPSIWHTFI